MSDRLSSGEPHLDAVLGGGLPANAINMLVGLPGTGKTILAQQYVFANATLERPAVYLSTVSEPFDKILRYGQTLGFFDPKAVGNSVFYDDLGAVLNEHGLEGVAEKISALFKERRPGIVVIDSFKALSAYAAGADFRRFLHNLAGHLSAYPASSFWVGEYSEDEIASAPEFAVADAIIGLSTTRAAERETRSLRVLKLRGSQFAPGRHAYRIAEHGITFQEHPAQLERIVKGFGWSLQEEGVELMYRSPVDLYIDEWVYDLLAAIERTNARRVLIDSLTDLQFAAPDEMRFREYMYSLVQRLSRQGVSLFMTSELPNLFEVTRLSEYGVSHLSDNVVLLQYIRDGSTVRRALTVLKTRASRHEPEIREFKIAPEGIVLGESIDDPQPSD